MKWVFSVSYTLLYTYLYMYVQLDIFFSFFKLYMLSLFTLDINLLDV